MNGTIGEISAAKYFTEKGYFVYLPIDGHAPFDLIAYKDKAYRVSVKSTTRKCGNKYVVELRQNRYKKKTNFSARDSDIIFVYVLPEQRFALFESGDFDGKTAIYVQ
jgi:hypothetical protein